MRRRRFLGVFAAATVTLIAGCTQKRPPETKQNAEAEAYFTCSMHPQVHQPGPGQCPICGMALIKVGAANQGVPRSDDAPSAHEIHATPGQLERGGIGRYSVVRKDLTFAVPVAGRMTSARSVAFQVFEADLQVVQSGLSFKGASASDPGEQLEGRIQSVDNLLDPSSRTVRAIGVLSRAPQRTVIDGGFFGTITAVAKGQLAIPAEAVLHTGQGSLVYLISPDNALRPKSVVLGRRAQDEYQVLSGLAEGDVVSTGPNFLIDSEAKIRGGNDKTHH